MEKKILDSRTLFVAFYSYKGGVGRTLALANMAWQAAKNGHKVVVIDFDLEAPGLGAVEPFGEHVREHLTDPEKKGGIFEAIILYRQKGIIPSLADFYATNPITVNGEGRIFIIPAGNEKSHEYSDELQGFDWNRFYKKEGGRNFFLNLRDRICRDFDKPDLVLIDSRTGLTDIGGISTMLLPDRVVILTGLNEQNLEGCKNIIDGINAYSKNRENIINKIKVDRFEKNNKKIPNQGDKDFIKSHYAIDVEKQNYILKDAVTEGEKKKILFILEKAGYRTPIEIVVAASHVPYNSEIGLTKKRLARAVDILGPPPIDIILPYVPLLSLKEQLLLKECEHEEFAQGYLKLYKKVTAPYTEEWKQIVKEKELFYQKVGELSQQMHSFQDMGEVGYTAFLGKILLTSVDFIEDKNDTLLNTAINYINDAIKKFKATTPNVKELYYVVGNLQKKLTDKTACSKKPITEQQILDLYTDAIKNFKEVLAIDHNDEEALTALLSIYKQKENLNQNYSGVYDQLGLLYIELSEFAAGRKEVMIQNAVKNWAKAFALSPLNTNTYKKLISSLFSLYELSNDASLMHQVLENCAVAEKNGHNDYYNKSRAYSLLGDIDKSIENLELARETRALPQINEVINDYAFKPVSEDPRFGEIIRKAKDIVF